MCEPFFSVASGRQVLVDDSGHQSHRRGRGPSIEGPWRLGRRHHEQSGSGVDQPIDPGHANLRLDPGSKMLCAGAPWANDHWTMERSMWRRDQEIAAHVERCPWPRADELLGRRPINTSAGGAIQFLVPVVHLNVLDGMVAHILLSKDHNLAKRFQFQIAKTTAKSSHQFCAPPPGWDSLGEQWWPKCGEDQWARAEEFLAKARAMPFDRCLAANPDCSLNIFYIILSHFSFFNATFRPA